MVQINNEPFLFKFYFEKKIGEEDHNEKSSLIFYFLNDFENQSICFIYQ